MLISVKHRLVLFLMPKCASTSVEEALWKHCEFVVGGSPRLKHIPLKIYERYIGKLLVRRLGNGEAFEKFCLFREPLDWLFSWYRDRTRPDMAEEGRSTRDISFAQFLHEHFSARPAKFARATAEFVYREQQRQA